MEQERKMGDEKEIKCMGGGVSAKSTVPQLQGAL